MSVLKNVEKVFWQAIDIAFTIAMIAMMVVGIVVVGGGMLMAFFV